MRRLAASVCRRRLAAAGAGAGAGVAAGVAVLGAPRGSCTASCAPGWGFDDALLSGRPPSAAAAAGRAVASAAVQLDTDAAAVIAHWYCRDGEARLLPGVPEGGDPRESCVLPAR
eukprot:SAG31_NODE_1055_length_10134_cov_14.461837_2_plen_115_part_00